MTGDDDRIGPFSRRPAPVTWILVRMLLIATGLAVVAVAVDRLL